MNVVFLNSIEKETYGGMEEWIRMVAAGLKQRAHDVALIGRDGSEYLRRARNAVGNENVIGINISGDFNPFTIGRIRRFMEQHRTDILVANFNKDVRLGGIAARQHGNVKVVWSMGINTTSNRMVHRWLTPKLVDSVIVPSQALKNQVTRAGYVPSDIVEVIPIGIDSGSLNGSSTSAYTTLRQRYALPENAIVAVTVGRFVNQKGHEYLIEAAPRIVAAHTEVHFLFLGDGPKEDQLKLRIEQLGLSDHFIFAGMLDNTEMELAGADLMVHPSQEEPFGIVLLEGMRAGLPIAASRVGGIPEVVDEGTTAHLFEPCNPDAIAETVISLLKDAGLMNQMGQQGLKRCRDHFTVEMMIDRVESHLKK